MWYIDPLFQKNKISISIILGGIYLWVLTGCTIEPVKSVPTLIATTEAAYVQDGKTITLSTLEPQQWVKTNLDALVSRPTRLIITTIQIDNKDQIGFTIGVYLTATSTNDEERETERRRLGYLGVYPPDQTGGYLFSVADEISELQNPDLTQEWALEFDLEILHEKNVDKPLEIQIAPVEWE